MQNIILTGFMGTGKTTVGRILAAALNRPFVDMDGLIAAREGRSIEAIFAEDGEAYFRALEKQVLAEVLRKKGQVVSTGGGALLQNREALEAGGILICLTADPEEIVKRLTEEGGRPLLAGDLQKKIQAILAERRHLYGSVPRQINTGRKTPRQVAEEIMALLRQEGITLK